MKEKQITARNTSRTRKAKTAKMDDLITDLSSKDSITRIKARESLVSSRRRAVPPLLKALSSKDQWVRWEAAKALSQIHDPSSVEGLVSALRDKMFDVRWLAAEGLIAIGRKSLVPLLRALIDNPDSVEIREGAHHVLHDMSGGTIKKILRPVLNALESMEAPLEAPLAAKSALDALDNL